MYGKVIIEGKFTDNKETFKGWSGNFLIKLLCKVKIIEVVKEAPNVFLPTPLYKPLKPYYLKNDLKNGKSYF